MSIIKQVFRQQGDFLTKSATQVSKSLIVNYLEKKLSPKVGNQVATIGKKPAENRQLFGKNLPKIGNIKKSWFYPPYKPCKTKFVQKPTKKRNCNHEHNWKKINEANKWFRRERKRNNDTSRFPIPVAAGQMRLRLGGRNDM